MESFVKRVQNKIVRTFSTNIKTGFNKMPTKERNDNKINDNSILDNDINEITNDKKNGNEVTEIEQEQNKIMVGNKDNKKNELINSNDDEITRCDYNLDKEDNELIMDDESDNETDNFEINFITQNDILNQYIEYQKSNEIRNNFFEKVQKDIIMKNKINHSITMLKIFKNIEENYGEIMHNNRELIINNIMNKDIELKNLITDGGISKGRNKNKSNDSKSKILSKKYQKLFASHTMLEEELDELKEKYQRIKNIEYNQQRRVDTIDYEFDDNFIESKNENHNHDSNDNWRSSDIYEKPNHNINIILKNRGLKNSKKFIKSSLDQQ